MNKILLFSLVASSFLLATPNEVGYDKEKEVKVKNGLYEYKDMFRFKKGNLIEIFFSKKFKGAVMIKYVITNKSNKPNPISKRPSFYSEKILPIQYRAKNKDYANTGFDKGHIANHADYDYDKKLLTKTYTLANIVPQYPSVNRYTWIKAEKFERSLTKFANEIIVTNIIQYKDKPKKIGNNISVPFRFYKIIENKNKDFKFIFEYLNKKDVDTKSDKLFSHLVKEIKK